MENNKYFIYIHINKINGKKYIGQTCQKPEKRWGKDGLGYKKNPKFYNAIQKYGWNNFEHNILFSNLTSEEADLLETFLINFFDSIKNGYNIKNGGKHITDEEKMKMNLHNGLKERWMQEGRKEDYSKKMKQFYNNLTKEERYQLYENRRGANHPASKKVVCRETGEIFNSLSEAAEWAGLKSRGGSNISSQIKGRKKSAGKHPETKESLHWYFLGEEEKAAPIQTKKTKGSKVKNLETQLVFNSIKEASKWCNCHSSSICISCKSNGIRGGGRMPDGSNILLHWIYI